MLGAVVTIFLSLFIIGLFVLGSAMLDSMLGGVEDQVTIQAFLSDGADQDAIDAYRAQIEGWDNVESVTYKSKDEGPRGVPLLDVQPQRADAVTALDGENPLPASLVIRMVDPQQVEATAERIMADPAFAEICDDSDNPAGDVQYGQGTVERLFSVTVYIRIAAIALVALLTFVAFVFINNTIRLAITARRREIGIMRLVGASNGFIRGPFITEGTIEASWARSLPSRRSPWASTRSCPPGGEPLVPLVRDRPDDPLRHLWRASGHRRPHRPVWIGHRHGALPQGLGHTHE